MERILLSKTLQNDKKWLFNMRELHKLQNMLLELENNDEGIGSNLDVKVLSESLQQLCELKYALDETSIIAVTDVQGKITYANNKFCEISKFSLEELIGKDHRLVNSGFHSKEFIKELWSTIKSGKVWRRDIYNKAQDGSHYWVDTTIVPFLDRQGKPYQYLAIRNEITEKKVITSALERLQKLSTANLGSNCFQEICRELQQLLGVSHVFLNEISGTKASCLGFETKSGAGKLPLQYELEHTPCSQLLSNDSFSVRENLQESFPQDELLKEFNSQSYMGVALKNPTGQLIGNICFVDDKQNNNEVLCFSIIKLFAHRAEAELERHKALLALQESEARMTAVINSSVDGILIVTENGLIESCNPAVCEILGRCAAEIVQNKIDKLLLGLFDSSMTIEKNLIDLTSNSRSTGRELVISTADGTMQPLYITVSEVKLEKNSLYTFTIRSLKVQRDTEKQLQSTRDKLNVQTLFAQRLSALAAMAGGIAHELNQPLSGIRIYAQMISKFMDTPSELNPDTTREIMSKVIKQVDRASKIITHMREFSAEKSDRELHLSEINLSETIDRSLELIGQQIYNNGINFINKVDKNIKISANGNRLEQIFINLFSNSKDSIVEKKFAAGEEKFIRLSSQLSNGHIELLIEDSGNGIPEEVRHRLFEPFVTSKLPGSGTGLGLSICVGILKDFDTSISLLESSERGTTFKITFPEPKQ